VTVDEEDFMVAYETGFEDGDGFTARTGYMNNHTGEGLEPYTWEFYFGTASTTGQISGDQSAQMRWYASQPENVGYLMSEFTFTDLRAVQFSAYATNGVDVQVSYSLDDGATWTGEEVISLTSNAAPYEYLVYVDGAALIRFDMVIPDGLDTNSRLVIDDLVVVTTVNDDSAEMRIVPAIRPVEETEDDILLLTSYSIDDWLFDISWESSDETVIESDGTVHRPEAGEPDATVTLTATVTDANDFELVVSYSVTVLAEEEEIVFDSVQYFDSAGISSSYGDGTYVGVDGQEFHYVHARDDGGYDIDGGGIMLRRADEPSSIETTFTNGLDEFYFEYRKAFTGAVARTYEVHITHDGTTDVYEIPEFGAESGADDTVHTFHLTGLELEGNVTVKIVAVGPDGNQQATFNNISWNEYSN